MAGQDNHADTFTYSGEIFYFDEEFFQAGEGTDLPSMSRQLSRQPVIDYPVFDDDSDEEGDNYDEDEHEDGNGEYGFFNGVVSSTSPGEDEDEDDCPTTSSDTWSDDSSDSLDAQAKWMKKYGSWYLNVSSRRYEPVYRFVQPLRTSCNLDAARLREPLSLLTKYSTQRLKHESRYFTKSYPSPSEALCQARQVRQGSPLAYNIQNADGTTPAGRGTPEVVSGR